MKKTRDYAVIQASPKGERQIRAGHPWVYYNDILQTEAGAEDGDIVDVVSEKGRYLGSGFYNHHSKIRVRLLSRNANDRFDNSFFERRLRYAWDYRKTVMGQEDVDACRLVFGESDQLPGLTVDRFHDLLVAQTLCLGIEKRKDVIFHTIVKLLEEEGATIRGLFERNDVAIRKLEGLEEGKGFYPILGKENPGVPVTHIVENGIAYEVDVENGQKTGFFLDQKYNRRAAAHLAKGRTVLDCFTHTGSFALNAAKQGAAHVHAVDVSEEAVKMAEHNAKLNHLENTMSFEQANVFDLLPQLAEEKKHVYDYIILDPPAFTKSRQTVENAMRGYKEINMRAMRLLPRGGYLATCSCSHFMTEPLFCKMLQQAADDAQVTLRQIEARQQAPDHPILWNVPETNYLKFYLFQVV